MNKLQQDGSLVIPVDHDLVLTGFASTDKPDLAQKLNDKLIYQNTLTIPYPYSEADAEHFIGCALEFERLNNFRKDWAIRMMDKLIGGIGCLYDYGFEAHKSQIGYWLAASHRGKGIMTRVLRAYSQFLFDQTQLVRLEAQTFVYNPASARSLEKAGFKQEGILRNGAVKEGQYLDTILFARLKS